MKKAAQPSSQCLVLLSSSCIERCLLIALVILLSSCGKQSAEPKTVSPELVPERSPLQINSRALFEFGESQYDRALSESQKLAEAIKAFATEPSEESLKQAQARWTEYQKVSLNLDYFYQMSRVAPTKFEALDRLQFRVAAYPIQPGFIDSFGEYAYSGLVHDIGFTLSETKLEQQHGLTDEEEVVLGLYAIEFLLFGENGERSASDFEILQSVPENLSEQGIKHINELASNRRRKLVTLQTLLLEKDMISMATLWQKDSTASLFNIFKNLDEQEQHRICGQAFVNYLTEILISLSKLAVNEEAETNQNSKNLDAANSRPTLIRKLEVAQQLATILIREASLMELSKQLTHSKAALTKSESTNNSEEKDQDSGSPKNDLTIAFQQLKIAIDQIQ